MRILMYHYVRPAPSGLPHFRYLHVDDFAAQLDALAERHELLRAERIFEFLDGAAMPENGIMLSFDDGLAEHLLHAAREMEARSLTGMFFVPTGPLEREEPLDVHRIHNLLGRFGGDRVRAVLEEIVEPSMVDPAKRVLFAEVTYRHQRNDSATTEAKRLLNYYFDASARGPLLEKVEMRLGVPTSWWRDFYLSREQVAELVDRGHVVGAHGVSHRVMSTLSVNEQREEISHSIALLHEVTDGRAAPLFCYPYGGRETFDDQTESLLADHGFRAAFAVDPRPVTPSDIDRRFALPRFDCNMFPFGTASLGRERAQGRAL